MTPAVLASAALLGFLGTAPERAAGGLLFHLSADRGLVADYSASGRSEPNFASGVDVFEDGARGPGLRCGSLQRLSYWAPGNIFAQRGTLAFFWRSREPVGPTEFPLFRVAFADHSSWDMVFLRIDYNGHGIDAFVTDRSLARIRVSHQMAAFPQPNEWMHLAFSWDETLGVRLYVNGRLAAANGTRAVLDAALDQFGPHSRIISPHQVQSDYNFIRGGDIDEIRIYDRMLEDADVAKLAQGDSLPDLTASTARDFGDGRSQDEWWFRYGWNRQGDPPPALESAAVTVRKVEVHEARDLGRWWWKATDGIRETTWPGVYNRSRLPGRNDYFQLPDWDCYSTSGRAVTFTVPEEPWNHLEMSGAAWGRVTLLQADPAETTSLQFERPRGQEKTVHRLPSAVVGHRVRFENVEQETPLGEVALYHVVPGGEPAGSRTLTYSLSPLEPADERTPPGPGSASKATGADVAAIVAHVAGRYPPDERALLMASPMESDKGSAAGSSIGAHVASLRPPDGRAPDASTSGSACVAANRPGERAGSTDFVSSLALPLVHIIVPNDPGPHQWRLDAPGHGLDGLVLELPPLAVRSTHGDLFAMNVQVKDPLWPLRNMLDFTFSVKPGQPVRLWLDLRDRILPPDRALYLTLAGAGKDFGPASLVGAELRLVFKPQEAAKAEHEIDRFTQARDAYAMLVEEHPRGPQFQLWNRYEGDLVDLLRVSPDHPLGVRYRAASIPGSPPPPFVQPVPPPGVPLWAFRQVEVLRRLEKLILYYVEHRQIDTGEFGGGLSDDGDLTNFWPGAALMGIAPERLLASLRRELDAFYANGMVTRGLPTIQTDELHSYEEGIDVLGQNLILDFGSPRQIERAMETARGVFGITGINGAGHRHIRSSYYSATRVAEEGVWGWARAYSYLVLQPAQLLVEYNGNPSARKTLLEIAEGLLAHRRKESDGTWGLPTAIEFATDRDGEATRGYLPWPLFWTAWRWTGERRYLDPILDTGTSGVMAVNASILDEAGLTEEWGPRILSGESGRPVEGRRNARLARQDRRSASAEQFRWALTGDKRILEDLYAQQISEADGLEYINTEGSLWIDRVGLPTAELQRARLGGVALLRNATFPGHLVSWRFSAPATGRSVAILVTKTTATALDVVAYNLETTTVDATVTGWGVAPGIWDITQGVDTDGDDRADLHLAKRSAPFERSSSLSVAFPPRAVTAMTFRLRTPGIPYWQRPDLGIDREDVEVREGGIDVTVHSLGAVATPEARIVIEDRRGAIVGSATVPPLPAPLDLLPRTARISVALAHGFNALDATVRVVSPKGSMEITLLNNSVSLLAPKASTRSAPGLPTDAGPSPGALRQRLKPLALQNDPPQTARFSQ